MKVIFDTDVLIDFFRSGAELESIEGAISRSSIYLSSIVAMELYAGARRRSDRRMLGQFFQPFERAGRLVSPNHALFCRAGGVLAELGSRFGFDAAKRRSLANDLLIALSAVSIGAIVVTNNRRDFAPIADCISLPWFGSAREFIEMSEG